MNNCGNAASAAGAMGGTYDGNLAGLYHLLDTLGSGHFAVVKLARHVFTGEEVAVKVIDKSKLDDVSKSHLYQEVRCMKLVQHPNVVRLYDVIETQSKLYLILELGDGGDLYDYIMKHESGLSESLARDYFRQIVRAISYCHRLHVVHRDLKPENVVFFERLGVVKLTDFGFSNKFCPGQKLETSCGSLAYSAPEILLGDSYDAPAVDVWSLGVILYMLVCGQPPFQEANDSETLTMIMDCKYTIPPHMSSSCKRLIGRMLIREPEKRATLSEIANDPWVTAGEGVNVNDFDTPLVAKEQLTEEDRNLIIKKMVSGAFATEEEILESLKNNDYNRITAAYYLLAEKKLKSKRTETSQARRPDALGTSVSVSRTAKSGFLAPPTLSAPRTPQDLPPRSRKCSIVREEEDDEDSGSGASRRASRSEGQLHLAARIVQPLLTTDTVLADNLTKVNLEEKNTLSPFPTPTPGAPTPTRRHRPEARRRARAGSCSSSEPSDDDSEKKKRAAEMPLPLLDRPRRDSHDDSSDSQERGNGCGRTSSTTSGNSGSVSNGGAVSKPAGAGAGDACGATGSAGAGRRRRAPAQRREARLRESRSLNRIAEVEEASQRWHAPGIGFAALCGRPFLRLLAAARPQTAQRHLPGLC